MRCMVLEAPGLRLREEHRALPACTGAHVLIRVHACGVCRTDLHLQDGELPAASYPRVPGHQAVGEVVARGPAAVLPVGAWVGAAWLAHSCGTCRFCRSGQENLCDAARFHGCHVDGGFATHMLADSRYCIALDRALGAAAATPLLCAGLIGYRTLRMAGEAHAIGIYGFGSAAHLVTQLARHEGRRILAFTTPGDTAAQGFARELGAAWAGGSDEPAPEPLDAALIFAPVGALVPKALGDVRKGGTVVCGGIHMSDIPAFPYAALWGERQLRSVANLTREDGVAFMQAAARAGLTARVSTYPLGRANDALDDLRAGRINGTAVLLCETRAGG
ncbi:MAG: zinc-binding alcohol dehydrogenase family protein [Gammaproteobacteria bacterium]|nr:zinc-binding alcohol dehydrogenase family protein [Gammaproteobacteria bacterium]